MLSNCIVSSSLPMFVCPSLLGRLGSGSCIAKQDREALVASDHESTGGSDLCVDGKRESRRINWRRGREREKESQVSDPFSRPPPLLRRRAHLSQPRRQPPHQSRHPLLLKDIPRNRERLCQLRWRGFSLCQCFGGDGARVERLTTGLDYVERVC